MKKKRRLTTLEIQINQMRQVQDRIVKIESNMNVRKLEIQNLGKEILELQQQLQEKKTLVILSPKEFAEKAENIIKKADGDHESSHGSLDSLMEDLLTALGYEEGISIIEDSTRWCG